MCADVKARLGLSGTAHLFQSPTSAGTIHVYTGNQFKLLPAGPPELTGDYRGSQ